MVKLAETCRNTGWSGYGYTARMASHSTAPSQAATAGLRAPLITTETGPAGWLAGMV